MSNKCLSLSKVGDYCYVNIAIVFMKDKNSKLKEEITEAIKAIDMLESANAKVGIFGSEYKNKMKFQQIKMPDVDLLEALLEFTGSVNNGKDNTQQLLTHLQQTLVVISNSHDLKIETAPLMAKLRRYNKSANFAATLAFEEMFERAVENTPDEEDTANLKIK